MSIVLDEDILAIWFLDVSETSNLLAGLSKDPKGLRLKMRMRYFAPNTPPDSPDEKVWREVVTQESCEALIARFRLVLRPISRFGRGALYELIRGDRSLDEFKEEFERAPFVHRRSVIEMPAAPSIWVPEREPIIL